MKVWNSIDDLSSELSVSVLTLGNFDGGHLGHQSLFRHLLREGRRLGLPTVALTFEPHPQKILRGVSPKLLMTREQKVDWVHQMKVDHAVVQEFNFELSELSPLTFMKDLLQRKLGVSSLVIGPTTHIGKGREGTPEKIVSLAGELGIEVHVLHPITIDEEVVQSSLIRKQVIAGQIQQAASFLGRNYRTQGRVIGGEATGRQLGFPTANLSEIHTLIPKGGVYATRTHWKGKSYFSATNIGVRPTVSESKELTVETFLLDFDGNLMDEVLELEWVERIRDEVHFPSREALVDQIQKDIEIVQAIAELERG